MFGRRRRSTKTLDLSGEMRAHRRRRTSQDDGSKRTPIIAALPQRRTDMGRRRRTLFLPRFSPLSVIEITCIFGAIADLPMAKSIFPIAVTFISPAYISRLLRRVPRPLPTTPRIMTRIINNSPIAPPALCYMNATQIRRPPSRPARKTLARYSVQLFITTRALLPQG